MVVSAVVSDAAAVVSAVVSEVLSAGAVVVSVAAVVSRVSASPISDELPELVEVLFEPYIVIRFTTIAATNTRTAATFVMRESLASLVLPLFFWK